MKSMVALDVINTLTNDLGRTIPVIVVAMTFGYLFYIYAFIITKRENKSPLPIWLHAFYLADDCTATVVLFIAAKNYDWFWFFWAFGAGMFAWLFFEIYCIRWAIKNERQEIWGAGDDEPVTVKQATWKVIGMFAVCLVGLNFVRVFTHDETALHIFAICNILACTVPGLYWLKNKSRIGGSLGMAITCIIVGATTFAPPGYGMWTTFSSNFDTPWFYICGIVCVTVAIITTIQFNKLPKIERLPNGKKPIW